jgi:hypothetical protein
VNPDLREAVLDYCHNHLIQASVKLVAAAQNEAAAICAARRIPVMLMISCVTIRLLLELPPPPADGATG